MFASDFGGSNNAARAALAEVKLFESVLGLRISLQKPLDCGNKLPIFDAAVINETRNRVETTEVTDILKNLIGDISKLLEIQADNQGLSDDDAKKYANRPKDRSRNDDGWDDILRLQQSLRPLWEKTVNKWHARLHFGSEHIKSKMKVFNQTVWEQIDAALQDEDRVVEKSRTPWEDSTRVAKESDDMTTGKKRMIGNEGSMSPDDDGAEGDRDRDRQRSRPRAARSYDMECYDDRTFYSTLLKSFIESSAAGSSGQGATAGGSATMRAEDLEALRKYKRSKSNVDRKASKGRKIRYTKHSKLENFMFPLPAPLSNGTRSDSASAEMGLSRMGVLESIDSARFFQSLFQ